MPGFLGIRGTGSWTNEERPKNWREGILYLYPNGSAPLTGLLSKLPEEKVDDPEYHWWTKILASQGGEVTAVYTDAGLSVPYVSGGVAGSVLYLKMAETIADEFHAGHQALLRDASHLDVDVNAKVLSVVKQGANSYISARLLEADDNGASTDLSNCDTIMVNGNMNPENGPMQESISYDATKWTNYTQIFRNSLELSRTAMLTRLRTKSAYAEAKRETLEYHSIEMEKAFLFGIATENTGANGLPERTTMGLIPAIKAGAPTNVSDYTLDTTYSGDSWLTSGEEWLDSKLEVIFRYGAREKMAFIGSGGVLGINRLAKSSGQIQLMPMTVAYGLKVMQWITPFGVLYLMIHPLFSFDATTRNAAVIFEPAMLRYKYVTDTMFKGCDQNKVSSAQESYDGIKEEWLTECGLEYHHPVKFGFLSGIGNNNVV